MNSWKGKGMTGNIKKTVEGLGQETETEMNRVEQYCIRRVVVLV